MRLDPTGAGTAPLEWLHLFTSGSASDGITTLSPHIEHLGRPYGSLPWELDGALKKWGGYCEGLFEDLAESAPRALMDLVTSGMLPSTLLTFATEALGKVTVPDAVDVLRGVLRWSSSPLVREGAVFGLAAHLADPDVRSEIERTSRLDPSPGVRASANEVLSEYGV